MLIEVLLLGYLPLIILRKAIHFGRKIRQGITILGAA